MDCCWLSAACRKIISMSVALWLVTLTSIVCASTLPLSPNLQAVLLAKMLMYEKKYHAAANLSVYVVDNPAMAEAFAKLISDNTDYIDIKSVNVGEGIPEQKYDLLYFNDLKFLPAAKDYAEKYRIVMLTGQKHLVEKGVTLGTGAENGRPQFFLNLSASFAADLDWEPKVTSIVTTFR